jgi:hypothetical protein
LPIALLVWAAGGVSQYEFLCSTYKEKFSAVLTVSEYEKDKINYPKCGSKKVEQRWAPSPP